MLTNFQIVCKKLETTPFKNFKTIAKLELKEFLEKSKKEQIKLKKWKITNNWNDNWHNFQMTNDRNCVTNVWRNISMETLFDKTFLMNKWNSYDKFFNAKIIDQNISNLFMCTNIFVNCDLCTQWVALSLLINLIIIIIRC